YSFSFNFKTKGDMQSSDDAIRITPRFYFVKKDGSQRQEVDIYYHKDNQRFIRIGSADDDIYRTVSLNEATRNVPDIEIANNALHYYHFATRFNLANVTSTHTESSYMRSYARHYSKEE